MLRKAMSACPSLANARQFGSQAASVPLSRHRAWNAIAVSAFLGSDPVVCRQQRLSPSGPSLARKRHRWEKLLYTARLMWSQQAEERVHPSGFSLPESRHGSRDAGFTSLALLGDNQIPGVRGVGGHSFGTGQTASPRMISSIFVIVSSPRKRGSRLPASSTRLLGARRDRPRMSARRLVWTCPSRQASPAVPA